jgi:hypothetical protein
MSGKTRCPANPLRNILSFNLCCHPRKPYKLFAGAIQRDEMRARGIRSGHAKISNSRAGNYRFEKDLNRALGARREGLATVIFLREVDPGSNDLLYREIGFRPIRECERVRRAFRTNRRFAEIYLGSRNL